MNQKLVVSLLLAVIILTGGYVGSSLVHDWQSEGASLDQLAQVSGTLSTGLVSHWKFDEGSGSTVSSSVGNVSDTLGSPSWIQGKLNSALSFNGSDYVGAGTLKTTRFTLSAWVSPNNNPAVGTIILKHFGYALQTQGNKVYARMGNGTSWTQNIEAPIVSDGTTWTLVTQTFDGSRSMLYVNGKRMVTIRAGLIMPDAPTYIGAAGEDFSEPFMGGVDDVRVYNRALSATEIKALYAYREAGVDTVAPVISNVSTSAVLTDTATVTWTTDEPSDTQVDFGLTNTYGNSTTLTNTGTGMTMAHTAVLAGLVPDTTYNYRVKSRDTANNLGISGNYTFKTAPAPVSSYTITSSAGTNGTISPLGTQTVLSGSSQTYTITANGGYQVASVLVDGVSVGTPTSYTFSNVTSNHTISVTFSAVVTGGTSTFGLATVGASTDTGDSNSLSAFRHTSSAQAGSLTSMSVYVASVGASPNNKYQMAIYSDANGAPGTLIASTQQGTLTPNSWNTLPISGAIAANTNYWLVYNTNGLTSSDNNFRFNGSGGSFRYKGQTFGTYPSSFGATEGSASYQGSIYATYSTGPVDSTVPAVSVTAPLAGSTLIGSVTLSANAFDPVSPSPQPTSGMAGVQFRVDGVNVGSEDTTSPYSISWNSTTVANGSRSITAVARDVAGNTTVSSPVSISVSNPVISYSLNTNTGGTGGTISRSPSGTSFTAGTMVNLTGTPTIPGHTATWSVSPAAAISSGCSAGINTCSIVMNANTTVTATFASTPPPPVAYYVKQGSTGNGSSWTNAYGSLPAILVSGATYFIAPGSYPKLNITSSGTAASPIIIRRSLELPVNQIVSASEAVTFESGSIVSGSNIIIDGKGWHGMNFSSGETIAFSPGAVTMLLSGSNITLRNAFFDGNWSSGYASLGIRPPSTGITSVEYSDFLNSSYEDQLAISPSVTGGNVVFDHNVFRDNNKPNRSDTSHRDVINTWTGAGGYGLTISNNIFFNTPGYAGDQPQGDGFLLQDAYGGAAAALKKVEAFNNVVYGTARFIAFGSKNSGSGSFTVYNNTIRNAINGGELAITSTSPAPQPTTANNVGISTSNTAFRTASPTVVSTNANVSGNLFGADGMPFTSDDAFAPTSGSTGIIDRGTGTLKSSVDITGRVRSSTFDIGAYEY